MQPVPTYVLEDQARDGKKHHEVVDGVWDEVDAAAIAGYCLTLQKTIVDIVNGGEVNLEELRKLLP